jgi:hypothetical protein
MNENEIAVREPNHLIALALEKNADPETLSKLMDLQERWEAGLARKAFVIAIASFKQEAPAVLKKGERANFGAGKAAYSYANLGSIVQEISALLGKYELSASWETRQDDKGLVVVSCHITHAAGHRESVTLRGPADTSGSKNPIQAIGSTVTYLERYTLLAALGLSTGEDDNDNHVNDKKDIMPPDRKSEAPKTTAATNTENTLTAVISQFIPSPGEKKPWTIIADSKKFTNFDKKLAVIAEGLKGQASVIKYAKVGNFHNLIGIEAVAGTTHTEKTSTGCTETPDKCADSMVDGETGQYGCSKTGENCPNA